MTTTQVLAALGIVLPVCGAAYATRRSSKTQAQTGIAADYTAIANRLDRAEQRLDERDDEVDELRRRLTDTEDRLTVSIRIARELLHIQREHGLPMPHGIPPWMEPE